MSKSKDIYSYSLSRQAWQRMKRNKPAMFGLSVIVLAFVVAVLGAIIRPDGSQHANDQKLQLGKKEPGFKVQMLKVRKNAEIQSKYFWELMFFGGKESKYKLIPIYSYEINETDIIIEEYTGINEKYTGKKIPINLADVLYPIDSDNKYETDASGQISFYTINGNKEMK
jgi:ABC-type microcin C transport system permease subunit YejE